MDLPSRPWLSRAVLALVVFLLLVPTGISALEHEKTALGPGTVTQPANQTTFVSVQGFHFKGHGSEKKPARLTAATGDARPKWVIDGEKHGAMWFYDVDPLDNGHLLVTATNPNGTLVFELDPETNERVWTETFAIHDTHDVDLINGDELIVANMRAFDNGTSNDRVFIYNRTRDEVVWEWVFRKHYPNSTDGGFSKDWTHVNDVDKIGPGRYLVSPRNFDQVIAVDRQTKNVTLRLGKDNRWAVLFEQHNPDYLEGPEGEPTVLVADSENDRVVEYAVVNGTWTQTWSVTGFNWPRDADRLPNGNTLVVDTLNHRVVEVTPRGEVVWEYYAAWAPYDAERGKQGSNGPTMREINATGTYEVHGGADRGPASQRTFSSWLTDVTKGTPIEKQAAWFAERYRHVSPWLRPVWMSSWALAGIMLAAVVALAWGVGEMVYQRRRIWRGLRAAVARIGGQSRERA